MKRALLAALALAVVAVGCNQTTSRPAARLSGTYSLALANDFLFVTSADRSELRVLDLTKTPTDFVRAPNPLEPLAIPVVDYPDAIARDLKWGEAGAEFVGTYVYAWGQGGHEISAVATDRGLLKEIRRINVGLPLTAVAARASDDGQTSSLYVATYEGQGAGLGTVRRYVLPGADALASAEPPPPTVVATFAGSAVNALAVLPQDGQIIVSLRETPTTLGDVLWIDANTGATLGSLRFPANLANPLDCAAITSGAQFSSPLAGGTAEGSRADCGFSAPTRQLWIDAVRDSSDPRVRVWGMLDEESCGRQEYCTGLEAVELPLQGEAGAPKIVLDKLGLPMPTLRPSSGLLTSFSLAPNAAISVPGFGVTTFPLLGFATTGSGSIFVFDARPPEVFNLSAGPNAPTNSSQRLSGGELSGGPVDMFTGFGAARNERISIVYGGVLSSVRAWDGGIFPEQPVASLLQAGDRISFANCSTDGTGELLVTGSPDAGFGASGSPSGCDAGVALFAFRAAETSAQPFVVSGSVTGLMGRVGPGQTFQFPAADFNQRLSRYFFHTESALLAPANAPNPDGGALKPLPDEQLRFELVAPPADVQVGDRYIIDTSAGYQPLNVPVDPLVLGAYPNHYVPTAVVRSPTQNRLYLAYPSASDVLEIDVTNYSSTSGAYSISVPYQ